MKYIKNFLCLLLIINTFTTFSKTTPPSFTCSYDTTNQVLSITNTNTKETFSINKPLSQYTSIQKALHDISKKVDALKNKNKDKLISRIKNNFSLNKSGTSNAFIILNKTINKLDENKTLKKKDITNFSNALNQTFSDIEIISFITKLTEHFQTLRTSNQVKNNA